MHAIESRDLTQIVAAIRDGVVTAADAGVDFVKDSVTDIAQAVGGALSDSAAANSVATNVKSSTAAVTTDVTSNGATDLTDGNKVKPDKANAGAGRRAGSSQAVTDAGQGATADKTDGGVEKDTGSSRRTSAHKAAA